MQELHFAEIADCGCFRRKDSGVMRVVTFFVPQLCDAVETMAYFLAFKQTCHIRLATSLEGDERSEHPWVLRRIRKFGKIEISLYDGIPKYSDLLIFYLARHARISDKLYRWRAHAKSAGYLPVSQGESGWRDWLRETVRSFPHYVRARKITFVPYIHPQFIANPDWLKASFTSIDIDARRRWRVGFLGNREPPERTARLAQCKDAVVAAGNRITWYEYGGTEANGRRGLEPLEYLDALSDMDFCISPPGWGLQWTHRTVEALVRGSIPIIEDPEVYYLGLRDGENCIVAEPDNWGAAVRRALELTERDTQRMRRNVATLRESLLVPNKAVDRFQSQLV
jgi:hypothetical protein